MKKLLSTNKGTLLAYSLIMIVLTSLTLFLLFAGIYEVSAVLGISSATSFVVLVIMLYGDFKKTEDNTIKPGSMSYRVIFFAAGSFIVLSIVRFIFLAAGLGLSAVMLYLTNDGADKFRLFYSVISIVPIGICICLYTLRGKNE